jgi:hypothetical protein
LPRPPRASPWEMAPPVGTPYVKAKRHSAARARRPRPRICLRKGCGRRYQPRCWNQRYCQDPECRRQVRRWQAARRQAKHRQGADVKARHAQAERARRQRAKATSQAVERPRVTPARGHAAEPFFPRPSAIGPAATNLPSTPPATRHATVAPPVARQFARSVIANASGFCAALWRAVPSGPSSIKPHASAAVRGALVPRA